MPQYGFRYGTDDGEMGAGYHQEMFRARDERSAKRWFRRRVRGLRLAASKPDGMVLWNTLELYHLDKSGNGELLVTVSV